MNNSVKSIEIKKLFNSLIEFIKKYYKESYEFLDEALRESNHLLTIELPESVRDVFIKRIKENYLKIENFSFVSLGKLFKGNIKSFTYNFNVKYKENLNENVSFLINVTFEYLDDNSKEQKLNLGNYFLKRFDY